VKEEEEEVETSLLQAEDGNQPSEKVRGKRSQHLLCLNKSDVLSEHRGPKRGRFQGDSYLA
jgi:hypothetical protein